MELLRCSPLRDDADQNCGGIREHVVRQDPFNGSPPPLPAAVTCFMRAVLQWRITPVQALVVYGDNPAQYAPVVKAWPSRLFGKYG